MDEVPHLIAGRYRVDGEIGRGGMGTVYRGLQLGLERLVAIKILKPEFAADPEVADRFMREARTMARLRHPSAATIFDAGTLPDNRPFIVMEYVEGATLAEILAREGAFAPPKAIEIAAAICDVLAAAHGLGVVHRDLKPSNIMLSARGVCVLDFGVAKVLATSADATRTHATTATGLIIGTPRYMSPEQCLGHALGPQSDLYSLGVLLYEMLAGRPPFIDSLPSAVLVKQATAPPPPLLSLRHDVPRPLALAVHTLLSKRAQDRPPNAAAARELLERCAARTRAAEIAANDVEEVARPLPLASTLTTLNSGDSFLGRFFASLVLIFILCSLLTWWVRGVVGGGGGIVAESSRRDVSTLSTITPGEVAEQTTGGNEKTPEREKVRRASFVPPAALEAARATAAQIADASVKNVHVAQTPSGPLIVATCLEKDSAAHHVYALERVDDVGDGNGRDLSRFRLLAHAALDTLAFHGNWVSEALDVNGDGYQEVLYTGTDVGGEEVGGRRLVLYVPLEHKFYRLRIDSRANRAARGSTRVWWSPNAMTRAAAPFRHALERRARTMRTVRTERASL